ncbi:EAL domain-containing protein [Ferrigenium sp. UT5]|uniref:bifunctional diguanylate cyclase/phosphodiesterase n=1 Tax=Ferrigenium sp. UT5 TaxID=3242105 RepID=UPI0035505ECB
MMRDSLEAKITGSGHAGMPDAVAMQTAIDQHAIVSIADRQGNIIEVNDKFCAISGYARDELLGRNHRIVNSGLHPKAFFAAMYRTIYAGQVWHGEICNRAKHGGLYWVQSTIVPLFDAAGAVASFISIRTDITQSKLQQLVLEEAQRLGKLGYWQLDLQSGKLDWSAEIYHIFEIDPERFGASYPAFLDLIHPEDRNLVSEAYESSVDERRDYAIEHRLLFADGRVKWVCERGRTEYDAQGRAFKSIGTVQDITAAKASEEKLRIASIAFETQEAILVTDAKNRIIAVNRSFERLTGYSAAEAIGRDPSLLKSGKHDASFYAAMWKALQTNGSWSGEVWDKRKDGSLYPKWLTITVVRDDKNEISQFVAIFMDISERKQAEAEIHRLAFYDSLTGLPNRRLLMDRLELALATSARSGEWGALIFMDMDNFKTLNDTRGHQMGDLMLVEAARRLKTCVREVDTVARLGGDEFVVVLQNMGVTEVRAATLTESVAEKISLAMNTPYSLKGYQHHSSASIGISLFHGHDTGIEELLKRADTAMYRAKQGGRNLIRFFEEEMQEAVVERSELETNLRQALEQGQLQLYFQSQIGAEHQITGAEVLLRWFSPQLGTVSPARFIPVAEENGMILSIGAWVLEGACRLLQEWAMDAQKRHLQLAVNVSPKQFRQSDFVEQVTALLHRYHFDHGKLKLELTEGLVLTDVNDTIAKMSALKRLGIHFSMDDFGTGYSSLSYLKRLPLDQLKIDQSFVRDLATDRNDKVIVRTIIDMARNFGLDVIAEGVESIEHVNILKSSHCTSYQGFFFSKPVPLPEFEALLPRGDAPRS